MTAPRIGSLFSGYGGLDLAVESVTGAITAWHCEYEAAPSKILAHHWPGVPNHGDITRIDWSAVEPVEILTGGSPCQDLSHAGRRAGMTSGTRSNLWVAMREAIARLRPRLVVWENVRGAYSACADSASDSELGRCPRCVDPDSGLPHDPNLRALGRVLGDLSDLGYDAQWHGISASDIGAPHGRFRVFVVAEYADGRGRGEGWVARMGGQVGSGREGSGDAAAATDPGSDAVTAAHASDLGHERRGVTRHGWPGPSDGAPLLPAGGRLLSDWRIAPHPSGDGRHEGWPESAGLVGGSDAAQRGDAAADAAGFRFHEWAGADGSTAGAWLWGPPDRSGTNWGQYEPAIRRWERILGRPAPTPTEPGPKGGQRLSARLVEWMMGLPEGWVTDVPDISRNDQLKALGNGVVPQQAAAALRHMLTIERAA